MTYPVTPKDREAFKRMFGVDADGGYVDTRFLHELARYRCEALEEAANHARCAFDDRPRTDRGIDWTDGFDDGTKAAATAIRALKEPKE